MKKPGPSYRYLHLGLGILALFLVIIAWGLIWVYSEAFTPDRVTIVWMGATLVLPIIQLIGGLGYACGKEWGRRLIDLSAWAIYLIAALLAGGLFYLAINLLGRTQPPAEVVAPNTFINWSFATFFIAIVLVLIMLLEVLLRGVLWKPGVMLFFKVEAARADLRAKLLQRMGITGFFLLLLGFALVWVWHIRSR
jgi:hypothetical protein